MNNMGYFGGTGYGGFYASFRSCAVALLEY